jgi:hypothetical protein
MLFTRMLYQLVLSVVLYTAGLTTIRFVVSVTSDVVVSVADGREALVTVDAAVGLLPCVDSHVNNQVSTFVEGLRAEWASVN